jgi:hypothetical protein
MREMGLSEWMASVGVGYGRAYADGWGDFSHQRLP